MISEIASVFNRVQLEYNLYIQKCRYTLWLVSSAFESLRAGAILIRDGQLGNQNAAITAVSAHSQTLFNSCRCVVSTRCHLRKASKIAHHADWETARTPTKTRFFRAQIQSQNCSHRPPPIGHILSQNYIQHAINNLQQKFAFPHSPSFYSYLVASSCVPTRSTEIYQGEQAT